jgi:hypothetical protein
MSHNHHFSAHTNKGHADRPERSSAVDRHGTQASEYVLLRSSSAFGQAFILFLFVRCKCIFITSLIRRKITVKSEADIDDVGKTLTQVPGIIPWHFLASTNLNLADGSGFFLSLPMCGVDDIFPVLLGRLFNGVKPSVVVYTD